MNYNTLRNKPTINYRELIGDNTVSEVGGITEEEFNDLLDTDLASYYTKEQIDELFSRSYVFRDKSGSIVTFDCPASVNGIDKVVSEIVAVQAGSGDPSPTNVRPFTGWSAVDVVVSPTTDVEDGTTYTTTLKDGQGNPMTCYGGQLVNENGVQRLENRYVLGEFDGSNDEGWIANSSTFNDSQYFYLRIGDYSYATSEGALSNTYLRNTIVANDTTVGFNVANSGASARNQCEIRIRPLNVSNITSLADFKSYLANNPLQVKYQLNTPTTIPQDNLAISSQDGTNNLWADSGDITVKALDKIIQG